MNTTKKLHFSTFKNKNQINQERLEWFLKKTPFSRFNYALNFSNHFKSLNATIPNKQTLFTMNPSTGKPLNFGEELESFIALAQKHQLEYMLVGGYAINFYGYQRFSKDIDFWLNITSNNLPCYFFRGFNNK